MALVGILAPQLVWVWSPSGVGGAYLLGLVLVFGLLLAVWRPGVPPLRDGFTCTVSSFVLVSCLVFFAGSDFTFLPLYFLAALGMVRVRGAAKIVAATVVGVGGYFVATVAAGAPMASDLPAVGLNMSFIGLFCAIAALMGIEVRRLKDGTTNVSLALASEQWRAERAERLLSGFGPMLGLSDLDGILRWTLEAARGMAGGTYAHVAELNGRRHQTIAAGDFDVCPSWWHPTIQRLVLWSCRENRILRSEEAAHGVGGFVAVPLGPTERRWGALVLGGKEFDAEDERALRLLADAAAPALEGAAAAPSGRDPVTGLPNSSSLHRVLNHELSRGRALTVLVARLDGFRDHDGAHGQGSGDDLVRRVGWRLGECHRRVFRYGEEEFVLVQGGDGPRAAREAALALRRLVSEAAGDSDSAPDVYVGFAGARPGEAPGQVLEAASNALTEARALPGGVAGSAMAGGGVPPAGVGGTTTARIVLALTKAAEVRGPYIGEHSEAVARIALLIGARLSFSPEQMHAVEVGALLHDLGKIGIPDQILLKPDRLTREEYEVIKGHPELGARIIAPLPELAPALPAVKYHHERFDGRGYPDGLGGEDIPLVARVISLADAFDAMIRDRLYSSAMSEKDALEEIEQNSGTQFDPAIVKAFLGVMEEPEDRRAGPGSQVG